MAVKRGLGIAKDSIFKNTLKKTEKKDTVDNTEQKGFVQKKQNKSPKSNWIKYSTWITPENKDKIDEISYFSKKEKRQVLNDIIEFYISKTTNKNTTSRK